jgi:hypothetical protein
MEHGEGTKVEPEMALRILHYEGPTHPPEQFKK